MFSSFRALLIPADYVQMADGKLNVLGAGWTVTGPQPSPFALAAFIEYPWTEAGTKHTIRFELIDSEGVPVEVPTPNGQEPLFLQINDFPFSSGFGVPKGTPLVQPVPVNLPPTQFPPGGRYQWRVLIDGEPIETGSVGFNTRELSKAA
jgi:Family of unknown function (DUF6941)